MADVFVTGATGFIGLHLVEALIARGDRVTCLVRESSNRAALDALGCRFAVGDITDSASMRAPAADAEVVYHLAAMLKQPWHRDFLTTNADGVRAVATACAAAPRPPVLLSVSSIAAAGPAPTAAPLDEDVPPSPVSRYGRSKLGGEVAARELAGTVPTTIVRPPAVIGERDRSAFPLFQTAARGLHVVPGDGGDTLSFVHVTDLVAAIIAAAERGERLPALNGGSEAGTGIYYAAADELYTHHELAQLLAPAVGRERLRVVPAPRAVTKLFGAVAEGAARLRGVPSIVNYDKMIEANAGSWICSAAKAKRQLGWAPAAPIADRFLQTGRWYQSEGWL